MEYLYPGGLAKAITFSYDDGQVYDRRLIEIFNQAGFKGTFHLNSGNLDKDGYVQKAELPTLYAEHEIACHGVTHRHPRQMNQTEWLREVWQDRLTLEELTGGIVQGMSGSPILQNGKLVGAVTHVVISNPKRGYGVFAQIMLEESQRV